MSLNTFSLGTFLLFVLLGTFQIKLYKDIQNIKSDIAYIEKNYTLISTSRQRAQYVDAYLEEIGFGIMDASILASNALDLISKDTTRSWYIGLTTTQVDSIRLNCKPSNYASAAALVKSRTPSLFDSITRWSEILE